MVAAKTPATTSGRPAAWWILAGILGLGALCRLSLLPVPLERDEGEYAYAAQLLLQGIPPYELAYTMKLPGVSVIYAGVIASFGQTPAGIHAGLLLVNALTAAGLFVVGRRLVGDVAGLFAAACYVVLSLSPAVHGVFANAEHFVVLPAVWGLALLVRPGDENARGWLAASGLLLGSAFLMKQHGAVFAVLGATLLVARGLPAISVRPLLIFGISALVPAALMALLIWAAGTFERFWFWTVEYAALYATSLPLEGAWPQLRDRGGAVIASMPFLWALVLLGVPATWVHPSLRLVRGGRLFALAFLGFSLLAILPGFLFRPHYFVLVLPAASLLVGILVDYAAGRALESSGSRLPALGFASVVLLASLWGEREFLFELSPNEVSRRVYDYNPFPEALEISRWIRENTSEDDLIAVIGSEPEIYFYARRRSATGYIYTYPLMEAQPWAEDMAREMIEEIRASEPQVLVQVNVDYSWRRRTDSPSLIFEALEDYANESYEIVGLAEIGTESTVYSWAPEVRWPPSDEIKRWMAVMRRRDAP